jgi:hypothetical protein
MKHLCTLCSSAFFAFFALLSCASAGKAHDASAQGAAIAQSEPKYVEVRTWKVKSAQTSYPDGMLSGIEDYAYDETGNILSEERLDGNKNLISKTVYSRKNEKTTESATTNAAGEIIGKERIIAENGRVVSETQLDAKDAVQSSVEYAYDGEGHKVTRVLRAASGSQVKTVYAWNGNLLVGFTILDAGGNAIKGFNRVYDQDNKLIAEEETDPSGTLLSKTVYVIKDGLVVRQENQNATGGILSSVAFVNDSEGNPIEITRLDRSGRPIEVGKKTWQLFTSRVKVQ